jgi:hypothetical protein
MIIGFSEAILNAPAMYGVNLPPALWRILRLSIAIASI